MTNVGIDTVSAAVLEAQAQRHMQVMRWVIIGWASSVIALGFCMLCVIGAWEEEVVTTETWTETTTVDQDNGDGGTNNYAGGDLVGEANYYGHDDLYEDHDGEEGAGTPEG